METPTIGSVEMASSHSPGRYCPSCGSRLARDNTDTLCALCRKKASEALRHSPTVPPEFWEADELQAAFASSHMGKVIYAYRHHPVHGASPLSQELVGGWASMTQHN
jgi:predicted amidophosphoribosyltransferase